VPLRYSAMGCEDGHPCQMYDVHRPNKGGIAPGVC
jgi:hypothetical protein